MAATSPNYCPICGTELSERLEGGRLRPACDNCGYVHFVNPVPGVGIVIEMQGGIVLIQRGHPPHKGLWALPSGFVEADESAEEAAIREAEEETGLQVEILELANINSFPEGPPVSGIMIFYRARPVGGTLRAGDDAVAAHVFAPEEIPLLPFRTHREMIAEWKERFTDQATSSAPSDETQQAPIRIRLFAPDDTEEVLSLLATIPANRHLDEAEWRAVRQRLYEALGVQLFVALTTQEPTTIVGFVSLTVVRNLVDGVGLISDMAVLPTYKRRGVGAALLEEAMRYASQHHLRALWVDPTRANDQARAFYAALGFEERPILRIKLR